MTADAGTALRYLIYAILLYVLVWIPIFGPFTTSPSGGSLSTDVVSDSTEESDHGHSHFNDELIVPDRNDESLNCPYHGLGVHVLSSVPLVIYIENFLNRAEADHLVKISQDKFEASLIWNGAQSQVDDTVRRSETALLERDQVVKCMEQRARDFQGWKPDVYIERTRSQRYGVGGHYVHHFDWSGDSKAGRGGRISTFMVYLEANCTGGGTNFPRLKKPVDSKWCRFVECDETGSDDDRPAGQKGITFKPIKGNAIFWENLRADGKGYRETWHAALPVTSGTKIGLNIWSWYQPKGKSKS